MTHVERLIAGWNRCTRYPGAARRAKYMAVAERKDAAEAEMIAVAEYDEADTMESRRAWLDARRAMRRLG